MNSEKEAKDFVINPKNKQYPIYFFKSDTSGEKKYEEFYSQDEDYKLNEFDSLGFINSCNYDISFSEVKNDFDRVFNNKNSTKQDIIAVVKKYVPDFEHIETGMHLDQKM